MKHKIISFFLIFEAILFSCKKDLPLIIENSGIPLLSKVIINNQPSNEYSYNGANLLSEAKSKFDFTVHKYDDKNQLVSTDYYVNYDILSSDFRISQAAMNRKEWVTPDVNNKAYTINYEYTGNGQLTKATYSRPSTSSAEYSEFSYDVNNRICKQTLYWENNETGYIDYSYDGKGDLIKEILYYLPSSGVAELSTTTLYTYDNEQNPYKSFGRLMTPGINTNPNNIVKESLTIHLKARQGTEKEQITENSYEYNNNGYPVSRNGYVQYIY